MTGTEAPATITGEAGTSIRASVTLTYDPPIALPPDERTGRGRMLVVLTAQGWVEPGEAFDSARDARIHARARYARKDGTVGSQAVSYVEQRMLPADELVRVRRLLSTALDAEIERLGLA